MRWALLAQCRDVLSRCLPEKEVEWGAPGLAERSLWVALQARGSNRFGQWGDASPGWAASDNSLAPILSSRFRAGCGCF